jgi:uncharacterized protein (TIGR03435 family)
MKTSTILGKVRLCFLTMPLILSAGFQAQEYQAPTPPMEDSAEFDISTVKPSDPGAVGREEQMTARQWSTANTTLIYLLERAYGIQSNQIIGAPAWASTDKYDVTAKTSADGRATDGQMKRMFRELLTERFNIRSHWVRKQLKVYEIVLARDGPKLTMSEEQGDAHENNHETPGAHTFVNFSMANLGDALGRYYLGRPVLDKTGLKGRYNFTLNWTLDEFQQGVQGIKPAQPEGTDANPDLFAAIRQQLGLKLKPAKDTIDVLVIDYVDRPRAN